MSWASSSLQLPAHEWITLGASTMCLALSVIALVRVGRSTIALPLGLLCLDMFVFNASDIGGHLTGAAAWSLLDQGAASFLAPLALRFVTVFVGGPTRPTGTERLLGGYCSAVAATCGAAALRVPHAQALVQSDGWALLMLPVALTTVARCGWLLARNLRRATGLLERSRTRLVVGGFLVITVGGLGDLLADLGFALPRLGPMSSAILALLLTLSAQRYGLFEKRISWLYALNAAVLGVLYVTACAALFLAAGNRPTLLVVAASALALALAPLLVSAAHEYRTERERLAYHATLGRFSEQMAHDLRNPLQAIKGAAEFLAEETRRGGQVESSARFLRLILDQVERLERVIGNYRRIGRVEPVLARANVNDIVDAVADAQALAWPAEIAVHRELDPSLPACPLDRDLVAGALENLVRNAVEAMPDGGLLTLRTTVAGRDGELVEVEVRDTGQGMDARVVQQAFNEFFTRKAQGTGLGLSFVRRVAEAHGGEVSIHSEEGRGTSVRLRLPVRRG